MVAVVLSLSIASIRYAMVGLARASADEVPTVTAMTLFARARPQRSALAATARPSTLRRIRCLLRRPGACGSRSRPRLRLSVFLDDRLGPDHRQIPNPRDRIEQIVMQSHRERPVLVIEERLHEIDVPALVIDLQQT